MPIVKCCAGCADKLKTVKQAGSTASAYIVEEMREEPKPGMCPLCFTVAHLSLYDLARRQVRYTRRSGGGEREKARGSR